MSLNPAYEAIGKGFVQQYYVLFDDPSQRPTLAAMYNVSIQCDVISLPNFHNVNDVHRYFNNNFNI